MLGSACVYVKRIPQACAGGQLKSVHIYVGYVGYGADRANITGTICFFFAII